MSEEIKKRLTRKEKRDLAKKAKVFRDKNPKIKEALRGNVPKGLKWDKIVLDELGKKIVGEIETREAIFLNAIGRLVTNADKSSFNLLVHSSASAGKDYIINNVLSIFPKSKILSRTRLSPTALNYWMPWEKEHLKPASWDEKVLYVGDVGNEFLNSQALKQMMSDGSFITITDLKADGNVKDIEIKGNPVVILTTANSTPNNEILSRMAIANCDESSEQSKRINHFEAVDYNQKSLDFIAHLKPCDVCISKDMRVKIAGVFPIKPLSVRRNFRRFLDYVRAVATFRQLEKEDYRSNMIYQEIEADWKDYDIARDVFMNLHSKSIPLNHRQKEIIEIIEKSSNPLEVKEIHNGLKNEYHITNLRNQLKNLENIGILDLLSLDNGFNKYVNKYTISEDYDNNKPIHLPNSKEILLKKVKSDKSD